MHADARIEFLLLVVCSCIDAVLDQAITPSTAQYIVWATGPRGTVDGFAYFHTSWPSNLQTTLQFGRVAKDNCAALSCPAPPSCPYPQETFDVTNKDATFVAKIGQSGGPRGYEELTSMACLLHIVQTEAAYSIYLLS